MKQILTFLVVFLLVGDLYSQIDKNLTNANWKPNKEKVIYGNTILRTEGKNGISGMTNVGYQSLEQIKQDIIKLAEKEMWTKEKEEEKLKLYEKTVAGGLIHLYLTRLTIDAANTNMFTIIVKNESGTEILRKELKGDIPQTPPSGSDYWWNYTTIPISETITGKISIYVIDKIGGDNNKFVFQINIVQ